MVPALLSLSPPPLLDVCVALGALEDLEDDADEEEELDSEVEEEVSLEEGAWLLEGAWEEEGCSEADEGWVALEEG